MNEFKVERWYKRSTKVLFKSEDRNEAIAFKHAWSKKNGVKFHLIYTQKNIK